MRLLIGTKLVLSFTIIILLMSGIGFLSFYSLNRFDDTSAVMINEEIPLLIAVSGVENDLLFSRLKLSEYAATGNKAHLQSFNSILDKSNEKILSLKSKPLPQEELALINEVEKSFGSYKTLSDSFILFYSMNPGDFETISAKEQKIDALLENALISKLDLFQTKIRDRISTSREMMPVVYQQILSLLIIFGVISILIAVAVSFMISRSVSKPLIKLAGIVPEFAKGNFDKKIDVKSKDEIGELAAAFNAMAKDLKLYQEKIKHHEADMELSVEKRTKELNAKVKELTDTRTATLNILEDVNLSKEELEKSHNDLVRLNKALEQANVELKKSEEYKNQFISITAHELKTPLASIHGFAGLLKSKKILSAPKQRDYYLSIIEQDSERLKELIDDILDLSRLDLGTMKFYFEKTDVREVFKELVKEMYLLAAKNSLTIKASVADNVPEITSDKSRLSQVLVNLVNNAIKYTPKKGGRITVYAERKGNMILFSVKDTGIGIPKSSYPKLFQRFYQVDSWLTRKVGGSGLGLSICKGMVEAMGGKIWFKSRAGRGTIFFFTLPIKSKISAAGEEALEVLKIKDKKDKETPVQEKNINIQEANNKGERGKA